MATYSHSRLETFRHCPRKFYYHYVAKVRLEEESEQIATLDRKSTRLNSSHRT